MRSSGAGEVVEPPREIDLRALGAALKRRRRMVVIPTLVAFVGILIFVNVVTPKYTAESQVLLENQESFFTRPERNNLSQMEQVQALDEQAVASQVALVSSRDIARRAIKQLDLAGNPEFDPLAKGLSPLHGVMILLGLARDPTRESVETRMVNKFLEKLTVFSPPKTRVITIQFASRDPDLAAKVANTVAQLYLQEQSAAKRANARRAADALAAQIADLRTKLIAADDERERYRVQSGLLTGQNSLTISGQQLADINSDLSKARSSQADAQAKAQLIRELLRSGKEADVPDVINNDLVRRVSEQLVSAQAALARDSRTLLPEHPHIKELSAQVAEYRASLKAAAKKAAVTLENEARIAGQRVANLEAVLTQQKKQAGVSNVDEVHLRSLERVTQSFKDQLESSTAKYQEALARQSSSATPSDARIISNAARPEEPSFPKKVPFVAFGTVFTLILSMGAVMAIELLSGRAIVDPEPMRRAPLPVPATPFSEPEPVRSSRRAWSYPDEAATAESASDPVFGPVPSRPAARASGEKLRMAATGGMLAATLAYLKGFGRSAADSRHEAVDPAAMSAARPKVAAGGFDWGSDDAPAVQPEPTATASVAKPDVSLMSDRIVEAHIPGRGLHVVGASLGRENGTPILIDLARTLSTKGRTIVVDLNRMPVSLAPLAAADDGRAAVSGMHGLAELLAGDSTFAEVIHRDHASRLHFIPTGLQEADFRDFDLILDALSETYDFILLLAPSFPQSEITKIMAPYADFVVLATTSAHEDASVAHLKGELIAAGAREVLVSGALSRARQDVA